MEDYLRLVNPDFPLPDGYRAEDLIDLFSLEKRSFVLPPRDVFLNREAAEALNRMLAAASEAGWPDIMVRSAWRSRDYQQKLYENSTTGMVARPGCSEHETGLAVDIGRFSSSADKSFYAFLKDHCHTYGFILRYPAAKVHITQIPYEKWHFRYVGEKAAREMCLRGWTLEEYHHYRMGENVADPDLLKASPYDPEFIFRDIFGSRMKGHWQHWPEISLDKLREINPDAAGWIYMRYTSVDYPILHGKRGRNYYLTHNFSGDANIHGQIFVLDADGEPFEGKNTVLAGHNMKDYTMFKMILKLVQPIYLELHPYAELLFGKKRFRIDWFAGFLYEYGDSVPARTCFSDGAEFDAWLREIRHRSRVHPDVPVRMDSRILTCTTCAYEDRFDATAVYGLLSEL